MGRGTLRTNWDPDVMADNINPCWLAEGIFFLFFFSQGCRSRGGDGKGDGILASGGMSLDKSGSAASADGCCRCLK